MEIAEEIKEILGMKVEIDPDLDEDWILKEDL